jgi:hypothetical protein
LTGIEKNSNYIKIRNNEFTWSNILDKCDERIVYIDTNLTGNHGWVAEIAGVLNENHVQCASTLIVDGGTDRIASNAYVFLDNIAEPLFEGHDVDSNTIFGDTSWTRNVDFFNGHCVVFRKKDFKKYIKESGVDNLRQSLIEFSKSSSINNKFNVLQCSVVLKMSVNVKSNKSRFLNEQLSISGFETKLNRNLQQYVDKVESEKND